MQAAPEEDLKHVFDVLDKGSNGQITADSLRSAIKVCMSTFANTTFKTLVFTCMPVCCATAANGRIMLLLPQCPEQDVSKTLHVQSIGDWEMTDDEIEIAIKLADKSGDGIIDYDEFIAFVFGGNEPAQRKPQAGAVPSQPVASTLQAELTEVRTSNWPDTHAPRPVQQHSDPDPTTSSASAVPPWLTDTQTAAESGNPPWLTPPAAASASTDHRGAAQSHDMAMPPEPNIMQQPDILIDNALYQDQHSSRPQSAFAEHSGQPQWQQQLLQPHTHAELPETAGMQYRGPEAAGIATSSSPDDAASLWQQEPHADQQWEADPCPSVRHARHAQDSPWQSAAEAETGSSPVRDALSAQDAADTHVSAPWFSRQQLTEGEVSPQQQLQPEFALSFQTADTAQEQAHAQPQLQQSATEAMQQPLEAAPQLPVQADDGSQIQLQAVAPPTKLPPLPQGRKPGTLPKRPIAPAPTKPRQLPGLSSSQLSAGVNRSKKQQS